MNPDEAHGWEKLAWFQQGQIILGKHDFLLAQVTCLVYVELVVNIVFLHFKSFHAVPTAFS